MNYQEYQEPTVMNFLKTTVSKARSSAANTNRKNDSQFDHMDYDDINQNLFTTFQPQPYKTSQQPVNKFSNFHQRNNQYPNNSYTYNQYDSRQSPRMVDSRNNNNSSFNSMNSSQQSNQIDYNSFKKTAFFNNPELNINKMLPFSKDNEQFSSFSSARQESTQLLQALSQKLNKEISNIDFKIHNFYKSMDGTIEQFFKVLRRQLYEMVEEAIIAGMRQTQEYKKNQEQRMVGELYKVKDMLQKEHAKIQLMKSDMNSNQWKKTAGDIIANDIEERIYDIIKRSSTIEPRRWQPPSLIPQLKQIQKTLIKAISLR